MMIVIDGTSKKPIVSMVLSKSEVFPHISEIRTLMYSALSKLPGSAEKITHTRTKR